ncbi:HNH endonuclease signature motif containing protein [Streptomyces noursei]|uniref:HNH endonuclease n=1 Tax=Streptomyces noursei TaxID=1971 RepID=UPI0033238F1E
MIWERLAVLTANEGQCFYCFDESQTMDHVIPFSDGGADELKNLMPICHKCNQAKGDKNPAVWHVSLDLCIRWSGKGSVSDGAMLNNMSLRELYLLTHVEILEELDALEEVQAEILDERRLEWFERKFSLYGYPSAKFGVLRARAQFADRIQEGKGKNYPTFLEEWGHAASWSRSGTQSSES